MSFRSLIRRSSVYTKRRSLPPLRRAPASSPAVVRQRERQPKGSRQDCNGNAGAGRISMTLLDGMTPMEFILRFTFTNPALDTTIASTTTTAHRQSHPDIEQQGLLPLNVYEEAKVRLAAAGSAPRAGGG